MLFASFSNFFFFPLLRLIYSHFAGSPMTTVRGARRSAFFLLSVASAVNHSNRELTAAASPTPPLTLYLFHILKGDIKDAALYSDDSSASFFFPCLSFPGSSLSTRLPDDEIFRFCCRPFFSSAPVSSVCSLTQPTRRGI